MNRMGPMAFGIVFGFVGGMMVYICIHELIPTAHRYDPDDKVTMDRHSWYGHHGTLSGAVCP